ncbi:kinase-like protein [Anaeromyces robustus]|uniref:non-specific serine/threonine protein kinase n=1 Tax=Anaeromyces robustus TaxID=1754192 RepID=A0A1Y1XPR7_9FUNG|nr:kinase-like protein [Anaeromyces robustus]|eukprot:ORX87655.1 kinase-like protein [Anaeromyces robustus]
MPQVESETPDENLKNKAEAEYTSKAVTKMAAPNTGSAIPHQHAHNTQNQSNRQHGENRADGSHHHHSSRRDVSGSNIVGNHFKIGRRIGEGSFGIIYDGINTLTNQHVAIKYESKKSEAPQLKDEYRTYKLLQGFTGIPNAYYFGSESMYNILVIDLLGPSLEDLFDTCNRKFSVKTVCLAAKQMLCRVQSVHEKSLVYRDIKPDNFLVGRIPPYVDTTSNPSLDKDINSILKNHSKEHPHPASQIYLIDFGMAKYYRDPKTLQHIPYKEKRSLSGTARYMSINTHLGREQSRRDDLEGLGHVLMYFLRGSLPWQGMKAATNKQKYEKIGEKKRTTSIKDLCEGFPEEFAIYMNYVRKLGFEETPDYDYLRGLFDKVLKRMGEEEDNVFDWMLELEEQRKEITRLREKQKANNSNNNNNNNNSSSNKQPEEQQQPQPQPQQEQEQPKGSNLSVPGNLINESNTTQNASMQVLRGALSSVDEMAKSQSQNIVDNHKENSPLNNEIKMDSYNDLLKEEDKENKNEEKKEGNDNNNEEKEKEKEKENKDTPVLSVEPTPVKAPEPTPEPTKPTESEKVVPEPAATPQPETNPTKPNEPEKTPQPETNPEPPKSTEPVTQEPVSTPQPTTATAPTTTTANTPSSNDITGGNRDPSKKKKGGFLGLFSCCASTAD